jgi:hypothetical protein
MEGLWVSMWAWVASRGPPNRRSQIAGPGGYVSVPLAPGTKHRTASRPCGYLCPSALRRGMLLALGNSEPRGRPRPLPGPGVGGLALVVTAAGPHPPPPHMSPPTSLLQPTAPQSPPTKAPGIFQSRSPRHCPKPPQRPLLVQQFVPPRPPHARVPGWGEGEARGRTRSTVAERSLDTLRDADAADGSSIGAQGRPQRRGVTAGSCRLVLCSTKGRQHPRRRAAPAR